MKVDCQFTPLMISGRENNDPVFVVIDVLRATSTIVTAFMNGCRSILPVAEVEEALRLAEDSREKVLLGGERGGLIVEGFDLGNSPLEYTPGRIRGQTVVFTTTNGSRAFRALPKGATGVVASFLNLRAVGGYCVREGRDVVVILSGREGGFSLEDAVCGGGVAAVVRKELGETAELTDSALASRILYHHFREDLVGMFKASFHGRHLVRIGAEQDLRYCAQLDLTEIVPLYRDGRIELSGRN
ncbi:MAG: 2-phosphosulfolactate phosphatase [Deltaproteobacteria bacterium]|nr:2-phosphosulfolactate phosphatase [Deltaproteobacteria bacterium]